MEYAIGIDLGGTSIKYALVDKAGNSFFEGKLPSFASVSAAKVMEQLIKAATLLKDEAAKQNWTVLGIGLGTPLGKHRCSLPYGETDEFTGSCWK